MRSSFIALLIGLVCMPAFAVQMRGTLGFENHFEKSINGEQYESQSAQSVRVGVRWHRWDLQASFLTYHQAEREGNLKVSLQHFEFGPWIRRNWVAVPWLEFYLGVGAGLARDRIVIRVDPHKDTQLSDWEFFGGAEAGTNVSFTESIFAELGGRTQYRENAEDPAWVLSIALGAIL